MKTITYLIKSVIIPSLLLASLPALAVNIWMEAENGAEYDPILVGSDISASDDVFLVSKWSSDYSERSRDDGVVIFTVGIPEDGEYTFWGRIRVPFSGAQPYDITFGSADIDTLDYTDESAWTPWASVVRDEALLSEWDWFNSGLTVFLTTGTHHIRLLQRVGGSSTHIDKILLTNDPDYIPTGLGEAEPVIDIINPYQSSTVAANGQLKVEGASLKNAEGNPVQLRGVSTHGIQWFPLATQQTIPATAEFFNADVVRLAMYVEATDPNNDLISWGGYQSDPEKLTARMEQGIEDAIAAGVYVIVDWHIHDVPSKHIEQAELFFAHIAQKYGNYPNVIYEICNEPVATAWSSGIKPYAESIIQAIREHDTDNLIIVGTPTWSQDVDVAAQDPLDANNILYAFHFYAATHNLEWAKDKVTNAMNAGIAVFVSEWGSSDVGTVVNNFDKAQQWLDFLNERNISWVNWSLGLKDESSSILRPTAPISGPWITEDLSEAGAWLKPNFTPPESNTEDPVDPDPIDAGPMDPPEPEVITIEAETVDETVGNVVVSNVVGYFDKGDAIIYNNVRFDNLDQIKLYVSGIRDNQRVEFRKGSITGQLLGVYDTQTTGGWLTYVWRTFDLANASGTDNLVMLANQNIGSDGGLMNLDKFELVYSSDDNGNTGGGLPTNPDYWDIIFDFNSGAEGWYGNNVTNFSHEGGRICANLQSNP